MIQMNFLIKHSRLRDTENKLMVPEEERGSGKEKSGLCICCSRYKLLCVKQINNNVLLYSPANYIQHPVINYNGKNEQEHTHTYIYTLM